MKRLILVLLLCAVGSEVHANQRDSLLVMFWNVETFFDYVDQGTGESDNEFSSYGERHWTKSRFYTKCDLVAKSIFCIGEKYGRLPDVIGLAEVENRGVLTRMLNHTLLRKYDYAVIHKESGDRRGIDVALLYRKSSVTYLSGSFHTPSLNGIKLSTRDILHAEMYLPAKGSIHFIVNHHPSKYGGEKESEHKRAIVMSSLKVLCDSLKTSGQENIVSMGDFNDTPDSEQFSLLDGVLDNRGLPLHQQGKGTIRYKGRWELIDFFLTSGNTGSALMEIFEVPFLMTYDRSYPGYKPLRTYSGPRYVGGVSDHCPILLWIH